LARLMLPFVSQPNRQLSR